MPTKEQRARNRARHAKLKDAGPHVASARSRRESVLMLCAGMDPDDVAKVLKVSPAQFQKIYYAEIAYGVGQAASKVAANLFRIATSFTHTQGCNAAIFWLKAKAGWQDRVAVNATMRQERTRLDELSNEDLLAAVTRSLGDGLSKDGKDKLH
jgi:hypothetical protein